MHRVCQFICAVAITLPFVGGQALAQSGGAGAVPPKEPQPHEPMPVDGSKTVSATPSEGHWQLDFKLGELRLYRDPESGVSYWYLTYKVINRTGQDRWWGPKFELLDDHGRLRRAGRDVPVIVTKRIEALIGNPLVEDQYQVLGEIRQGEANAKESFLVWPAGEMDATELHLFARGMSSEISTVADPKTGESHVLHKTLRSDFRVSGDPAARGSDPVECELSQWIMR